MFRNQTLFKNIVKSSYLSYARYVHFRQGVKTSSQGLHKCTTSAWLPETWSILEKAALSLSVPARWQHSRAVRLLFRLRCRALSESQCRRRCRHRQTPTPPRSTERRWARGSDAGSALLFLVPVHKDAAPTAQWIDLISPHFPLGSSCHFLSSRW